jgi:hypothetical protein
MIFRLVPVPLSNPMPYPGAQTYWDMPIMPITIHHAGHVATGRIFVDSMCQIIVLPESVAEVLGIELRPPGHLCRWKAWVGFAATQRWLFGNFGGLEHFHFILDPHNEEFLLDPRDSLPRV